MKEILLNTSPQYLSSSIILGVEFLEGFGYTKCKHFNTQDDKICYLRGLGKTDLTDLF